VADTGAGTVIPIHPRGRLQPQYPRGLGLPGAVISLDNATLRIHRHESTMYASSPTAIGEARG